MLEWIKDGNGAVWVGFRPDPTCLDTRTKKPVYCPAPLASMGTRLTRSDQFKTKKIITNSPLTTNNKSTKPNLIEENSKQLSQVEFEEGNGRKTCKFKIEEGLCFLWQQY